MSKEIVFAPRVGAVGATLAGGTVAAGSGTLAAGAGAILLAGGVVTLAGVAAFGVAQFIQADLKRARQVARRERAELASRLQQEQRDQERTARAQRVDAEDRAAARLVLERLSCITLEDPLERSSERSEFNDFLAEDKRQTERREKSLRSVSAIERILGSLPKELVANTEAPFGRLIEMLQAHRGELTSGSSDLRDTLMLQDTVERTIRVWTQRLEHAKGTQEDLADRARELLQEAFELQELSFHEVERNETNRLVQDLVRLIREDRTNASALNSIQERLAAVKERITPSSNGMALQRWVSARVGDHMADMDYSITDPFPPSGSKSPNTGIWRLPDGGQVRVTVQPDGKLEARLDGASDGGEEKWCADARKLLRRLVLDGMPYEIAFERRLPAVAVVAVETADELLEEEDLCAVSSLNEVGRSLG